MRRRKHEFSAMMVLEVGKSWDEADADTAEAIDFLEYYARQALRMFDSSSLLVAFPKNRTRSTTSRWASARSSRPGISPARL